MMCLLVLLINGITDRDTIQIKVSAFRLFDFVGTKQPADGFAGTGLTTRLVRGRFCR